MWYWVLFFMSDESIGNMAVKAMESMGEKGQYTYEEINKLRLIKEQTPEPIFPPRILFDDMERQQILREYGDLIRSKLSNDQGENDERSVATNAK